LRPWGGAPSILIATVIGGMSGFLVTFLTYLHLGPSPYLTFAVFWSTLYVFVGSLSGIQQEFARATEKVEASIPRGPNRSLVFSILLSAAITLGIGFSADFWITDIFIMHGQQLFWPFALGVAGFIFVAALSGSLYGASKWSVASAMIVTDGLTRLTLVSGALIFGGDLVALAWSVVLPFPIAIFFLWPFIRKNYVGTTRIKISYGQLTLNVARTIFASASLAMMVNGLPFLLTWSPSFESEVLLGELVFLISVVRAPLIIAAISMQSYLVVHFRGLGKSYPRAMLKILLLIGAITLLISLASLFFGKELLTLLMGGQVTVTINIVIVIVISSGLLASMIVASAGILAAGKHLLYATSWLLALILTIAPFFMPGKVIEQATTALLIGPLSGLTFVLLTELWPRLVIGSRTDKS
jgi:O-antigen/teichoic acid export membrane protein